MQQHGEDFPDGDNIQFNQDTAGKIAASENTSFFNKKLSERGFADPRIWIPSESDHDDLDLLENYSTFN